MDYIDGNYCLNAKKISNLYICEVLNKEETWPTDPLTDRDCRAEPRFKKTGSADRVKQ
jgi:hypothetical protein